MTKTQKIQGYVLLFVVFVVLPFGALSWIWRDRCHRTSIALTTSQDGTWIAETLQTDCGATMKVATELVLKHRTDEAGDTVLVLSGKDPLGVKWAEARKLLVTLPLNSEVVKMARQWQDVQVAVEESPTPAP